MGKLSTYICTSCNYSVASSGGPDFGMHAVTDTYICTSCKEIVEVKTGEYGLTYLHKVPTGNGSNLDFDTDSYVCPECGSAEGLTLWDTQMRPCPKCDGIMELDPDGEVILWD